MNSVLSSMSLYYISFYLLSEWPIHLLIAFVMHSFGKVLEVYMEGLLINWQLFCSHKHQDGLGVRNLQTFQVMVEIIQ